MKYLVRAGNTKTTKDCGVQVPTRAPKKKFDNLTLTGYIIYVQQKGENMSKKQKTYKGRPVKESHQTEDNGWSREDTYHKVSDGRGGHKYVNDYELD